MKTSLFLTILMILTFSFGYPQGMDFSGMTIFWEIMEILEKDSMPSDEKWEELFNTPGYVTGNEHEFRHDYFKKFYTLAFMPSKQNELEKELQKASFYTPYLKHIADIKQQKESIKKKQKELENSNEVFSRALKRVKRYLPDGSTEKHPEPTIAFMVFGPDGRGYETILVDLVYYLQNEELAVGFIAHEMHHYYLGRESVIREGEAELLWIIEQIYAEGLADQVDKKINFFGDGKAAQSERAQRFRELVHDSPNVIRKMDSLMKSIVISPELFKTNALKISGLVPQSGHPTGYFMANAVSEDAGPECLVEDFGNPFSFFRRYNVTASGSGGKYPVFSEESMQLIGELEKRYAK